MPSSVKHQPPRKRSRSTIEESLTQPVRRPLAKMRRLDQFSDDDEDEAKPSQLEDPFPDTVGSLLCETPDEDIVRIVVTLQEIVVIGRDEDCVRTNSQFTMVALSDLSRYGFTLNGVLHRPDRVAKLDTKRLLCKTYILKTGDRVELPGCPAVFTWVQGPAHAVELLRHPNRSPPIFNTANAGAVYPLHKAWIVHNCPIGSGTFGTVNMASHRHASWLQVACKTIAKPETEEDMQGLRDEVGFLKRMDHPNLNGILDRVNEDAPYPRVHLILELMTGGDLFAYCEKHPGGLEELEVKWIASQLVDGLSYLHNMRIAHRDLKPENILLAVSAIYPRVVIGDFGHAISYEAVLETVPESEFTNKRREFPRIGTASYIPPERLKAWARPERGAGCSGLAETVGTSRDGLTRRERIANKWFTEELRLDAWALGVTLYTAAFGEHPYEGGLAGPTGRTGPTQQDKAQARSYTQVKGKNSWARFRQSVGEGRSIGTSREDSEATARYMELLDHFDRHALLDIRRGGENRLLVLDCRSNEWLKDDRGFLEAIHDRVIEHGEVLHFDRVQQIMDDIEHGAGVPSSFPASTASQEESIASRWMMMANAQPSPIQSPNRRPSPIPEGDEDIEMDETGDGGGGDDTIVNDTIVDDTFEDDGDDTYQAESGTGWSAA
ncbi:DNA damage response protein kinase DUN1 [Vanrija pseudolonga]|uniref:DNA damage response protein kinase DUN1 n=1 Tax=Vanrija pseudolonga TaxID=143232 RepID=A0AAF0YE85_9TREE|nr:DNA damage response protein kinase DUN1 [Vanrija pseudolonga]